MNRYDAIYLSPHLDDAALSCGGQIFQQTAAGHRVLIVTAMAGDPPEGPLSAMAREHHERWQLTADAVARRREEDKTACQILGADCHHWEIPDCLYRRHPQTEQALYQDVSALFGAVAPAEEPLVEALAKKIAGLPLADQLFAPLAIGHHVDHQLVRQAAEKQVGRSQLCYYEDYPYAAVAEAVTAVIDADLGWQSRSIPLSATAVQAKIDAITAFRSQLSTFFQDQADLDQQIRAYTASVGGERIWWQVAQ